MVAKTHGLTNTTEYGTWYSMKNRCYNKNYNQFKYYGGRGIKICDEWRYDFQQFINDMGKKPSSKHSIDRINNDGDYTPDNCRWATPLEQANNQSHTRKITFNGKTMSLSAWARKLGIGLSTLSSRLNTYGWSIEESLTRPKFYRKGKL